MEILTAFLIFLALGAAIGVLLALASRIFHVEHEEKYEKIKECLPGANCGGCGFAGCDALAEAISKG